MAIVYHYCSTYNALSILREHRFRLTDLYRMNDVKEAKYLYELYMEELSKLAVSSPWNELLGFVDHYNQSFWMNYVLPDNGRYIGCFSKEVDLTSQWISYGDNGQGYAIGIDEALLEELSQNKDFRYSEVQYYQASDIHDHVLELYKKYSPLIQESPRDPFILEQLLNEIRDNHIESCFIKSYHFKSEEEKRLVFIGDDTKTPIFQQGNWIINKKDFYAKSNYINTYLGLYFEKSLIKEILIGPRNRNEPDDILVMLEQLGYHDVRVKKSKCGYI